MSQTEHLPEIESLRLQVAELSQKLAERDQSMQDLREQSDLLRAIVEGTAGDTGKQFFQSLVTHLAQALHIRYALVGELTGPHAERIRSLAFCADGRILESFEYEIRETPCHLVIGQTLLVFEQGLREQFPNAPILAALGAESFCGVPLRDKSGKVLGVLAVMDDKPLRDRPDLRSLMTIFAARATAELQRQQAETALHESERLLRLTQFAMSHAIDAVLWADDTKRFVYANEAACRSLGYTRAELLALSIPDIAPHHDPIRFQQRLDHMKQGMSATYESVHRRKDGSEFPIEASVTYLEHEGQGYTCGIVRDVSEKKRAEEELQRQRRHLVDAQALAHLGSWDWDIDGGEVRWSDEQFRIFGHEPGAIAVTYDTFLASLHPDDHDPVLAAINDALLGKRPYDMECRIVCPNGEVRFIHARGDVHRDATSHPLSMAGTVLDITERKQIEEALRASKERWHLAVRGSHDGIWDWDIHTGGIFFSSRWKEMRGYEDHELANVLDEWRSRIHLDDLDRVLQSIDAYLAKQAPEFCEEYRVQRKDGSYMWVLDRGVALWDEQGRPVRMAGSESDITERKRVKGALRESEERYRTLYDETPTMYFTLTTDGTVLSVNRFGAEQLGYDVEELVGRSVLHVFHEEDKVAVAARLSECLTMPEQTSHWEFRKVRKDGQVIWVREAVRVCRSSTGEALVLVSCEDITARKRAEEALRRSETRLNEAQRVAHIGSWELDIIANRLWWSDEVFRIFEIDPTRFGASYEAFLDIVHPEDRQFVGRNYTESLASRTPYNIEHRLLLPDGRVKHVHERCETFYDTAGTPIRSLGTVQEITERKRAETKLRLTQFTIDHAVDAVYWINQEAKIVDVNEAASLMLGYSKVELCMMTVHDLNPDFQADMWPSFWAETRQRKTMAFETVHRSKTGQRIPVEVSINHLCYEGQELHCAFVRNIEERKKAQEELRRSKSRLTYILERNPAVVYARQVGDGWPVTFITPNVYELLGYTSVDIVCDPDRLDSLIHPDDDLVLVTREMQQLLSDGAHTFIYRMRHRDGIYRWIENRARLINSGEGTLQIIGTMIDVTQRKNAEEALEEERQRLVTAQLLAHLGSWEWEVQTGIITWSDENYRIFGYEPGSIQPTYEVFAQAIHPQDRERTLQATRAAVEKDTPYDLEFRIIRSGGEICHVHSRGEVTHDDAGRPLHMAGTVLDITERKRAEEALRVSEERFNLAVQGSNTGIWDWDLQTNKTYFSPLWKSMLGHEEHELRGEFSEWEERLHPDDRERSLATVRAYLDGTAPQYELEHRLRHKDGSYRWILARGVSISDAEGKPYRMAGSHIDITEQKQTQEARARSERQLRTVLDALPVGVWFTDATGKVRLTNPAGRQIWAGVQQVGLEGTEGHPGWWENVSSSGEPHRWALARALTKGEATLDEELSIQCLDGTSKVIINSAVPLFGENGQVSGAIIVNQDITERKALERDRAQTQAFLQSILENIPHIITVKDAKTLKIVQMNRAAEQVLGLDRHVLADKTLYDCLPEGEANALWDADMDTLQRRTLVEVPEHVVKREGERDRIFLTKKAPIFDAEGEPQYILTISENITERTIAEAAVRQRAEHIIRFQRARLRLMKVDHADRAAAWKIFTETGGSALGVERVSIWLFNEDRSAIVCRDLYRQSTQNHEQGAVLEVRHYPKYFQALASDVVLATSDARTDPRTGELREHYLPRLGITSMMDAPIHLHGNLVGVLCLEHTGPPREWTSEEQSFAASVADQVALSLEAEERVLAETALRSTKNQLQAILDHSPAVIFVKDTEGRYLLINRRYEELHHVSPNEVMGKTDYDIFDRETADGLRSNDRKVLHAGCPMSLEETVPVDDGILTVISTIFPLKDANGRPYAVCGIATDITERKRAEDALRQSHAFIRQIIDTDPNFIFTKDREGRFTLVNQAVADAYGSTVEDLVGKTDADFNRKADEGTFFRGIDLDVMNTREERFIPEEIVTDAHGNRRWVQTVKRPILDETGRAIMVLGAATDITDRKRMEEALRQRERDLRAAIEERERISQDLHDGILQSLFAVGLGLEASKSTRSSRNRKATDAPLNQAIDQLNRVMHEIRNFIAGLGSDLLRGKDLPTALHHMLESLTQNHATRVRLAVEARAAQAVSAEQSLHLLHVIQEAVSNCIRHGRAQEATVSLKMLKQGVRLSIRDNGSGFNPEAAKGSGHGLINMAARAQKIGGRFTVFSKINEGTRVVFDLPKEAPSVRH